MGLRRRTDARSGNMGKTFERICLEKEHNGSRRHKSKERNKFKREDNKIQILESKSGKISFTMEGFILEKNLNEKRNTIDDNWNVSYSEKDVREAVAD